MGYPGYGLLQQILFGTNQSTAILDFPGHLDAFVNDLAPGHMWTADRIIDELSLLPYYSAFLPSHLTSKVRTDMREGRVSGLRNRMGIATSRISWQKWLRFCPVCVQEERSLLYECYWHRLHQVAGVIVCPKHGVFLEDSCIAASGRRNKIAYVTAEESIPSTVNARSAEQDPHLDALNSIAVGVGWLLGQRSLSSSSEDLHLRTTILLARQGLLSSTGNVRRKDLVKSFLHRFPSDLLARLGCELNHNTKLNWLTRLSAGLDGVKHPLYHLLFFVYANSSPQDFFNLDLGGVEVNPFGRGPWPCLNVVCSNYGQNVIDECTIRYDWKSGKPIGHFKCQCGFAYRRGGPDLRDEDRLGYSKTESYGEMWEERLRQLWQDPLISKRAIGRELVIDVGTVDRQAKRLGLHFPNAGRYRMPAKARSANSQIIHTIGMAATPIELQSARAAWLAIQNDNPVLGVTALRRRIPLVYRWLEMNDLDWLTNHLPSVAELPNTSSQPTIGWVERDMEVSALIGPAAEGIRHRIDKGKLVRITKPEIGAAIGMVGLLENHLQKMPMTEAALRQFTETSAQFAVRRIKRFAEQYSRLGSCPTRQGIIHELHLAKVVHVAEVSTAVDDAVSFIMSTHMR